MAADDAKRPATALRIKVRHADLDTFVERFAVNIARSGIFIPTRQPKPVGEEVRFEIRLANDQAVLVGQGVVRWTREIDETRPKQPVGMGVALQRVSKESRDVLLRMLEVRKARGLPDPPGGLPQPPEDDEPKHGEEGTTQVRAPSPAALATAPTPAPGNDDEGKTQIRSIPRRPQARQTNPPPSGGVTNDSPTRVGPMPVSNDSPTRIAPVPARPTHVVPRSERSGPVGVAPEPRHEPEPAATPTNPFAVAAAAASAAEIRLPDVSGATELVPAAADAPTNPFAAAAAAAVLASQPEPEAPIDVPPAPRPPSAPAMPASRASRQRPAPVDFAAAAAASLSVASTVADELDQEIDVSAVVARARSLASGDPDHELDSLSGGVVVEEVSVEEVSGRLARQLGTAAPSLRKRPRATPDLLPTPSRPGPVREIPAFPEDVAIPTPSSDPDDSSAIAAAAAASAAAVADSASDAAAAADAAADAAAAEASAAAAAAIAATTPPGGPGAHRGAGAASRGRRQLTAPPPPRPKSATTELRTNEDRLARERAERERIDRDRQRAERERQDRDRQRGEREAQDRDRIRRDHEDRDRMRAEREVAERERQRTEQESHERARDKQRRELAERDARRRASYSAASGHAPAPARDPLAALDLDDAGVDVDMTSGSHELRSRDVDLNTIAAEAMGANELKSALTPPPELVRSIPHVQATPPVHARPSGRTQPPPLPPRAASRTQPPPPTTPALEEALAGLDQAAESDTTGVKTPAPTRAQSVEIEIDDDFEIEIDIDVDDE